MSAQTKGLAALLAAHGRNGDTELMHVTKGEVAALNRLKRGIDGADLPRNPRTGLREANFFNQYVVPVLPAVAGLAAGALTGGTMAVPAAALAGGVTGAGAKALQGGSTQDVLIGGGLGAISGAGAGSLGAGLNVGAAGAGAAEAGASGASGAGAGVVGAESAAAGAPNAFVGTPTALPGSEAAFGTAGGASVTPGATTPFQQGLAEGMNAYSGAAPTEYAMFGEGSAAAGKTMAGAPASAATAPEVAARPAVSSVEYAPFGGDTAPAKTGINWDYLGTDKAAADASKLGIGTLGTMSMYQGDLSGTDTGVGIDKTLPKSEVYYTSTGERRTRVVDRPQYGNVNMARGGDVYGDYDGADEAPDGGYHPGGGLNYANGGLASYGFGGFVESIQPGGAWGNATADLYGVVDKNAPFMKDITPGGAIGQLQPGRRDWERKQAEEAQRKKDEEAAGIAAAAKAKEKTAFEQQWSNRYGAPVTMADGGNVVYTSPNQVGQYRGEAFRDDQGTLRTRAVDMTPKPEEGIGGLFGGLFGAGRRREDEEAAMSALLAKLFGKKMASGGVADLGHYSDGGSLLRGPGDGVSDSIPASIEGKRPARLADGEFVIPARAVSELGNGSTEAGSKQLYAMLDRIAKKRKSGKGLAYQSNPKKILPV